MGLKAINPLIKAVVKKAYVTPRMEVRTLESLGLKMEQLTCDIATFSEKTIIPANSNIQLLEKFIKGEISLEYIAAILRNPKEFEETFRLASGTIKDRKILAESKAKILQQIDGNIANHGVIVMQSYINPQRIKLDPKTGIRYVKLTQDDIILCHGVDDNNAAQNIKNLIESCKSIDKPYISLSLNNCNSSFFYNRIYGIVPRNRSINATSGGYGQISGYKKTFDDFVASSSVRYKIDDSWDLYTKRTCIFLHDELLKNLNNMNIKLSDKEYVQLFKQICKKEYFNEITEDIIINGKIIKANILKNAIEESHCKLASKYLSGDINNTEVSSIIDNIDAITARVDCIDEIDSEIIQLLKNNPKIKLYLLGKPQNYSYPNLPEYIEKEAQIKKSYDNWEISIDEYWNKIEELKQSIYSQLQEKLKPHVSF